MSAEMRSTGSAMRGWAWARPSDWLVARTLIRRAAESAALIWVRHQRRALPGATWLSG